MYIPRRGCMPPLIPSSQPPAPAAACDAVICSPISPPFAYSITNDEGCTHSRVSTLVVTGCHRMHSVF
jgi:hypothetical protein